MAYIFMDESGDLGFDFEKAKTSQNFLITCVISSSSRGLERIIKKYFRALPSNIRQKHRGTFHCNSEKKIYRDKMFSLIKENEDCKIIIIRLNKKRVYTNLQQQKTILYNYITNIILDRILTKQIIPLSASISFIASQRETNGILNSNFKNYISDSVLKKYNISINIVVAPPSVYKGLQIADACSWAAFRKYEHNEEIYYNQIKEHIILDDSLFK